ncbi:hypothetical protein C7B61_07610, partial [filamentous cyanobacterium CCP1]
MNCEQALEIANTVVYAYAGRHLSPVETLILKGSWQNLTYEAIAEEAGYSVRYIKGDVGAKFWKLLGQALGEPVSKTNFRAALERCASGTRLTNQGAIREPQQTTNQNQAGDRPLSTLSQPATFIQPAALPSSLPLSSDSVLSSTPASAPQCEWNDAIDVSLFYNRTEEFKTLLTWIAHDRCRLVAILGMGGIGKTALSCLLYTS